MNCEQTARNISGHLLSYYTKLKYVCAEERWHVGRTFMRLRNIWWFKNVQLYETFRLKKVGAAGWNEFTFKFHSFGYVRKDTELHELLQPTVITRNSNSVLRVLLLELFNEASIIDFYMNFLSTL